VTSRNTTGRLEKKEERRQNYWIWAALLVVILFTSAIRIRLLGVPLERDEGEYAYAGQLILQGIPPYVQAYNMKMPGIYAAYALILAVFGQTIEGIHLGLLVVNIAAVLLLFILARKLFDPLTSVVAVAVFSILSLGQIVNGFAANAEHFVILPALAGILLLMRAFERQTRLSVFGGGVLLGVAFLMKQHGAAFIIFAGLYVLFSELSRRPFIRKPFIAKGILFLIGVLLPFGMTCLIFWWFGVFERFWFWTFNYARQYVSAVPLAIGLENLKTEVVRVAGSAGLIWFFAGIGLISLLWNRRIRKHSLFMVGFLIFSFLATCPGLYFRPHYFIFLLPAVAMLAGIGVGSIQDLFVRSRWVFITKVAAVILALAILLGSICEQYDYFFRMTPVKVSRTAYGFNSFPESLEIAKYIRANSTRNDLVAILGSEPQILFYANRRSATGYIYAYPLMEPYPYAFHMQREMIGQIESAHPEFLVFVNLPASWLVRSDSEKMILKWFQFYHHKYYRLVGVIDIISRDQTIYRWDKDAVGYQPRSEYWITVFRRTEIQGQ
jgi:hypothetical protein